MRRKIALILVLTIIFSSLIGCNKSNQYTKYNYTFYDAFDTVIQVVAYAKGEGEFNTFMKELEARFAELHRLYD